MKHTDANTTGRAKVAEDGASLTATNELAIRREAAGSEYIDENGGGAGVRMRNRQGPKQPK